MKLLDQPVFENIANAISGVKADTLLSCKVESYSCKMAGDDKKLFRKISENGQPDDLELLSEYPSTPTSLTGSVDQSLPHTASRRTVYYLKATLNAAYPDYDFSNAKSQEFFREPNFDWVTRKVADLLCPQIGEDFNQLLPQLWAVIHKEIDTKECEIYSYNPDSQGDPFSEDDVVWSFNFFFFNKKMKRLVFLACIGSRVAYGDGMDVDDDLMFE